MAERRSLQWWVPLVRKAGGWCAPFWPIPGVVTLRGQLPGMPILRKRKRLRGLARKSSLPMSMM